MIPVFERCCLIILQSPEEDAFSVHIRTVGDWTSLLFLLLLLLLFVSSYTVYYTDVIDVRSPYVTPELKQ